MTERSDSPQFEFDSALKPLVQALARDAAKRDHLADLSTLRTAKQRLLENADENGNNVVSREGE